MARCGCASTACYCSVTGQDAVNVTGTGTSDNPYVVAVDPVVIHGATTSSAVTTVTGAGTHDNPFVVSVTSSATGVQR